MRNRALRLLPVLIISTWVVACGDDGGGGPDAFVCVPVDDSNPCTMDACENNMVVHTPTPGVACPTGTCNAQGMCAAPTCTDGFENGDETDTDCGGSCAPASTCADGDGCAIGADCTSGVCGANNTCSAPACGDGVMQTGEMCDDGNMTNGDGCDDGTGGNCRPTGCGNGVVTGTEACDDGNATNGDGCDNNCTATACGNGVTTGTETCDDGNTTAADGCSMTCATEAGYMCTTAVPSVCSSICGDGMIVGTEACDDAPPAESGDGCSMTCTVEPGYVCTGMPSTCVNNCGNNTVDPGEDCDDGNTVAGDGCGTTCLFDIGCPTGSTQVAQTNAMDFAIPDGMASSGVSSPVTIATAGSITKLGVYVSSITHTYVGDLRLSLIGPTGRARDLSSDNGGSGDNMRRVAFDDAATTAITTIVAANAPYTGRYRPEQSLSTTAGTDFLGSRAAGDWNFRATDAFTPDPGTINSWTLIACVNPTAAFCGDGMTNGAGEECDDGNLVNTDACDNNCAVTDGCGDGNLDAGEVCDDNNIVAGDGCSATCQVDITCATGETPILVSNTTATPIPDNDLVTGVSSTVTVATAGRITKLVPVIRDIAHTNNADLDIFLVGPSGVQRELSTDNGGTGDNYLGTQFIDDASLPLITSGTAPMTGRFRPEQSAAATAGVDFLGLNGAGTWTLRVFDDLATNTGTLNGWTFTACVNPTATYCGDGMTNGAGEECDDGNTVNTDACNNLCQIVDGCGDGNLDTGEACDDNNIVSGDGCSATCQPDISCPTGQTAVVLSNTTSATIGPSNNGGFSTINVPNAGLVRRVIATVNVTYPTNGQIDLFLRTPWGVQRDLSSDQAGANYTQTQFSDTAGTAITSGTAPYTGAFRPEATISDAAGFANQSAQGNWTFHVAKDTVNTTTGTINSWTLAVCVDPAAASVCGNGIVEATETCDDANTTANDGCSATCQVEITCPTGSTPLVSRGTGLPAYIPDNNLTGITNSTNVTAAGMVTKAIVVIGTLTHQFQGDMEISLVSPMGTAVLLSDNRGAGNDDFVSTIFDDAATAAITTIANGGRGRFRPEAVLSGVNGQAAAGDWLLRTADTVNADTGVLISWTLGLCVQ